MPRRHWTNSAAGDDFIPRGQAWCRAFGEKFKMKRTVFLMAFCVGALSAGSAFADHWVTPVNGNLSSIMLPDGDVMMKVQLPAKEYAAITEMMASKENTCTLFHSVQAFSLVLVCGAKREYIPNY
jgi:hypothetical protein